jgi:hypothetical protein
MSELRIVSVTVACAGTLLVGCPQPPKPEAGQPAASTPVALPLTFADARPGGTLAHLTYTVDAPTGQLPMEITDPAKPSGAELKLPECVLKLKPFVMKPKIGNAQRQECKVNGCYTLCVRGSDGVHIGDFEINDWGALVLKNDTTEEPVRVHRATTPERTMYFVYDRKAEGGLGGLRFALEYAPNELYTAHELQGDDGWQYRFESRDGTLKVHPPDSVTGLHDLLAQVEEQQRDALQARHKQWQQERKAAQYCTGGG